MDGCRWLVTGGCGFIGAALIGELLRRDPDVCVRVLDDLSVGKPGAIGLDGSDAATPEDVASGGWAPGIRLARGDIRDAAACRAACEGADVIVHLAANTGVAPSVADPMMDCLTNVVGTLNMLEAARSGGVPRFVMASSGAPAGEVTPPIHEEMAPRPVSPYGASKLAGEGYCSAYARTFGIDTVALRFGNVYGPGSGHKTSVVAQFCGAVIEGRPVRIFGAGTQTRDFIYLGDLLDALFAAAETPDIGGEIFQIASAKETTVNELADAFAAVVESRGHAVVGIEREPPRQGDVLRNFSDTRKARERLGWTPRTSLEDGLARTFDWFVAHAD
ncbi:NAD-dependent epimerase/dehydratase family protein [Jannaschia sp. Os4]|uniref:NAD-dependent epimerase/dehydratase family protein n=1 Tax=Jannaschia sp. Os4 TaxID=2807617 RepID=UPI00193A586F|nr:NAD-dependent epimerase/dehydratase family protein [Jannaschia sp. Os4]MBM2576301.1 NAD-dependent epimerase/dehydratase family protein [Jannaschia sp. Os4]